MTRIRVEPSSLRGLAVHLYEASETLRRVESHVAAAWGRLDFEVRQRSLLDDDVYRARRLASALANEADALRQYVSTKADRFQSADLQGANDLASVAREYPMPVPTPTLREGANGRRGTPVDPVRSLHELLKPIDRLTGSRSGAAQFSRTFEGLGRWLNGVDGTRGNIKMMRELSGMLAGTAQTIGNLNTVLDARDLQRFQAGQLTNLEFARVALATILDGIVPIPFLNTAVADWLAKSVPNPNGHWHGFVPEVR